MRRRPYLLGIVVSSLLMWGCSGGPASTSAVSVSDSDMKSGEIHVANTYLDSLANMAPDLREKLATKDPHMSEALKKGAQIDPATKARIDSLGITLH
jgi:hypothetical protein